MSTPAFANGQNVMTGGRRKHILRMACASYDHRQAAGGG
jgi:hypothetical protein